MAIRYSILKKTRLQAVVKIIGSGSVTIPISEFALADETLNGPIANVNFVYFSICQDAGNYVDVVRDGLTTLHLMGGDNWSFAQGTGFVDNEKSDKDVTVNVVGQDATVILLFSKQAGYVSPNYQVMEPHQKP